MKILHVIAEMNPEHGGVCKAVRTIVEGLMETGISNEVVSLDDPNVEFLEKDPFIVHALGKAENPWSYSPNLLKWLKTRAVDYDFIVIHGLWLFPSYAVYRALSKMKENKPKYFVMPHGMLDPYFQKAKGRRLKAFRNWLYWKTLEKKVVNHAEALLFTCEEEKRLAATSFKPYKPKAEIIVGLAIEDPPNYNTNMEEAFYLVCPEAKQKPYFLFISRIHEKKGLDELVEAYEKLIMKYKASKQLIPILVIAGPGLETKYGKHLQKDINEKKIINKLIFFPGMLKNDAKWGAFYKCEAFVLPSHQENFGIAVVEALACSKPILISNQVNIWREIQKDKAGIVEKDTVAGTFKALQTWLELEDMEKNNYSKNALKCYRENYAMPALIENWKNLLNQSLHK